MVWNPNRRWLRFSLSTLIIVVSMLSVVLGYYVNWQRHRAAAFDRYKIFASPYGSGRLEQMPLGLRVLGEYHYPLLIVWAECTDDEMDRLAKLFPDSMVVRGGRYDSEIP